MPGPFVVTETRPDGGIWTDRFPTRRDAEQHTARLRECHRGRTYEITEEGTPT